MHDSGKVLSLTRQTAKKLLPARDKEGHKYTFGNVLVIGGSRRLPGAAALASEAVLSAGAGAVTLAAPESVFEAGFLLPEIMRWPLTEGRGGTLEATSYHEILKEDLSKFDAFAVGPGMGDVATTQVFFSMLLAHLLTLNKPIVLDADALNCLSRQPIQLTDNVILTPHIGEARRLLQKHEAEEKTEMARALRHKYGAQIVLKSAQTLIAGNDNKIWENITGNSGLATAGSGDVLTGTIAAFLAQGCSPLGAAQLGVFIHGLAGELASAKYTEYGVRAGLVSAFLAPAFKSLMID
jgi:hydroxyethylthiazole kinase-like uncharacterized protein yjeF